MQHLRLDREHDGASPGCLGADLHVPEREHGRAGVGRGHDAQHRQFPSTGFQWLGHNRCVRSQDSGLERGANDRPGHVSAADEERGAGKGFGSVV